MTGTLKVPDSTPSVALQHYIDARLSDHRTGHEREHAIEHDLEREARDIHNRALEARFGSVNEFRQVLSDQASNFMPRDSFDRQHSALIDRTEIQFRALVTRVDAVEAQATKSAIVAGVVMGLVGLLAGALLLPVVSHFLMGGT